MRYITLTQGQQAKVNDEDFEWLSQWKWCAHFYEDTNSYRAVRGEWDGHRTHKVDMAREILGLIDSPLNADHKNHDTLDNQRGNLRRADHSESLCNRRKHRDNKSGYKGVYWHKVAQKWAAFIGVKGRRWYLGLYSTPEEAHQAYARKANELHGEFACIE